MELLRKLYREYSHEEASDIVQIPGGGSNRRYYRITAQDGSTLIGAVGDNLEENKAFCYLAHHFQERGLPVPSVLAVSEDGFRYLQTDLGNRSLFQALECGRKSGGKYSLADTELLKRTICLLPDIQIRGMEGLDFDQCYPQREMDRTNVMFDLNYFKYCFLKATGVEFNEIKLEESFRKMADDLSGENLRGFMYRDFQARNVMLDDGDRPTFIDFQGGRLGPVQYDLVSFLWQATDWRIHLFAQEVHRHRRGSIPQQHSAMGTVPSVAGFGRIRIPWIFRTQETLPGQHSTGIEQSGYPAR